MPARGSRIFALVSERRSKKPSVILAGDIGGTRARLALFDSDLGKPIRQEVLESGAFKSLDAAVLSFLGPTKARPKIAAATFGVAGPVVDQKCKATNLPWMIDARALSKKLDIPRVTLFNDLVALSLGALTVPPRRLRVVHGDHSPKKTGGNIAVIAAGTGLGEAALIWDGEKHSPCATEGGHTTFAATTPLEWQLFEFLKTRFGHVSYERIVAGPGFSTLYEFFRDIQKMKESRENQDALERAKDRNEAIATLGVKGTSEIAARAVALFVKIYGAEMGNLALKTMASSGVYVAGGIAIALADTLARGEFIAAFLDKGRMGALLEKVPVAIVMDSHIGIAGSAHHAASNAPAKRVQSTNKES
jgi:glucokinase